MPSFRHLVSNWFGVEWLGLLSTGLITGLIPVLSAYNHKPQPDWGFLSLNFLIAIVSVTTKATTTLASSESIGQLKWSWLADAFRQIKMLRTFDEASRGVYGSIQLIWQLRGRHFAVLGAAVTAVAVFIDPFAQNLVRYYPGLIDDGSESALFSTCTLYNPMNGTPTMNDTS
ncbi:hypothetical protein BDW74DRAFT_175595 [Aspergillus multicolor]|uniref:DUF3176 domain-containing protein n=1 Tax=Aspergillus multicolor TaxID=41759 RepID=UPI003CCDB590